MDPNPHAFPILSYVMSRLPKVASFKHSQNPLVLGDIEQPSTPDRFRLQRDDELELMQRLPLLQQPALISSMAASVADVAQARSVLRTLGDRPDHEVVDAARARVASIDDELDRQLEEMEGPEREEFRAKTEKEKVALRAVIQLDEMHESYGRLLREAEARLVKMYDVGRAEDIMEGSAMVQEEGKEVNEKVIAVLREGIDKCSDRVDLSGQQLRHLPEAFGKLRGLISLNLSDNQLEAVPDAIAGLECLEELRLKSNNLTALPDSIGLLLKLKILDVSGNKLKSLPDSISKCRCLVELNASYNELAYLPTNIGYELQDLQKLWIHLNKLRSLPTSICEMISLRLLDANFNELRGLPHAIGKLINLEILNLSRNFSDLQELPATFGHLTSLRELDLSNNQINALPDTFGQLDKLTKLKLDENPLVIPPMEVVIQGVEAVKEYMSKRRLDMLLEEERKSIAEANSPTRWLTRSASWLNTWVGGASDPAAGQSSPRDAYLNQQL